MSEVTFWRTCANSLGLFLALYVTAPLAGHERPTLAAHLLMAVIVAGYWVVVRHNHRRHR